MLKVAHVIKAFDIGGAEVLLREAFENENFVNTETDSCIIILNSKNLSLLKSLKTQKVYVFNIFSFFLLIEAFRLYFFLKKNKYNIVHCHLPLTGIILVLLNLIGLKTKLVYSEHNIPSSYHKLTYTVLGYLYRFFDSVIFVSLEVKNDADNQKRNSFFHYRRGVVINNGVNINKFNYKERALSEILTIGTIVSFRKEKRLDRWIEIAKKISEKKFNQFQFILAGHGNEMPNIISSISACQLNDVINLPGTIYNTADLYHKFDFFLMTSDWEGLPVALLEAMACGCIPVVTNVGGIKQLQLDQFGFKYDNEKIEDAVEYIVNSSLEREKINLKKKQARQYVEEHFSLEKQLGKFLSLYNSLTKNEKIRLKECVE